MDGFPLSPQQRRLAQRGRADAQTKLVFETPEALPLSTWSQRIAAITARHEIFRTRLDTPAGLKLPLQCIGDEGLIRVSVEGRRVIMQLPAMSMDVSSIVQLATELHAEGAGGQDPMQYADASEWLDEIANEPGGAEARAFWRKRFESTEREPFDRATGSARARVELALADDTTVAGVFAAWVTLLTKREGVTPNIGVIVEGRIHDDLKGAMGAFARCAPARLSAAGTFAELTAAADKELGEIHDLRAQLDVPGTCADATAMFTFEDLRQLPEGWTLVEHIDGAFGATACLAVVQTSDGGTMQLRYDPETLTEPCAQRLLEQLDAILEDGRTHPERPALHCNALPVAHRALLLERWSPPISPPTPQRIEALIVAEAAAHPDAPAVILDDERVSYARLLRRARNVAAALDGVRGQRVALCVRRGPDMVAAILGTWLSGNAYVPIDPAYPDVRIRLLLDDARAARCITDTDDPRMPEAIRMDRLSETEDANQNANADQTVDDVAYVIYTSGSTGRPKGVEVTHRQLHASNDARVEHYGGGPERYLLLSSYAFDSSVAGIFWTLASGGTLVLPAEGEERDPERLAELIDQHGVRTLLTLPSLYGLLVEYPKQLAALKRAIVAGEACPRSLVERHQTRLAEVELHNEYGPTEATVWATVWRAHSAPVRIGKSIAHARTYVVDERGELAPIGAIGELWIGGASVARGYLDRPALTAERFGDDPFGEGRIYRTGDRVRWRDGELEFLGRGDDQVKVRGFRIELGEVEAALSELPGIDEVAAAVHGEAQSARLIAYLVSQAPIDTGALRATLSERLPAYMIPALARVDDLPRTPNGKIDRDALPEPDALGRALSTPFVAPADPVQEVVAGIWGQVLSAEKVGVDDDFFELGGTSLLVTQVIARIRQAFRIALPLRALFDHPNVDALVTEMRADGSRDAQITKLAPLLLELARGSADDAAEIVTKHR